MLVKPCKLKLKVYTLIALWLLHFSRTDVELKTLCHCPNNYGSHCIFWPENSFHAVNDSVPQYWHWEMTDHNVFDLLFFSLPSCILFLIVHLFKTTLLFLPLLHLFVSVQILASPSSSSNQRPVLLASVTIYLYPLSLDQQVHTAAACLSSPPVLHLHWLFYLCLFLLPSWSL